MSESSGEVYILGGTGSVGSELAAQVLERQGIGGDTLRLGGIASREGLFSLKADPHGERKGDLLSALVGGREKFRRSVRDNGHSVVSPEEVIEGLFRRLRDGAIVVDCTPLAEEILGLYTDLANRRREIQDGRLITVNKSPLVICGTEVFNTLAYMRRQFGFAGTVMAGTGAVIDEVLTLSNTTEGVSGIEGCLSGTLGYLCSAMEAENASDFMFILTRAKNQGFTEPDPRVDLSGVDVAKKLVILARAAGHDVQQPLDVEIEPFIPKNFLSDGCDVETFMARNREDGELNLAMKRMFDDAAERGEKLRYVAEMKVNGAEEKPTLRVGFKSVKIDHPLASLNGTGNRVLIYTKDFEKGQIPRVSIGGPGAGPKVTAQAVLRDIYRMVGL